MNVVIHLLNMQFNPNFKFKYLSRVTKKGVNSMYLHVFFFATPYKKVDSGKICFVLFIAHILFCIYLHISELEHKNACFHDFFHINTFFIYISILSVIR